MGATGLYISISITFHIKNNKKGIVRESFVRGNFLFSGVKNYIYRFLTPAVLFILFLFKKYNIILYSLIILYYIILYYIILYYIILYIILYYIILYYIILLYYIRSY